MYIFIVWLRTFLQRANAIIVIKFPGMPTKMNTMHAAVAKCSNPSGYSSNSLIISGGRIDGNAEADDGGEDDDGGDVDESARKKG